MLEVEVRAKIDDLDSLRQTLATKQAKLVSEKHQIDHIYGAEKFLDDDHKIIEGGLSARIRCVDDKKTLEFKEICRTGSCLELACPLGSPEEGEKLLAKLDFEKAFTLDKTRQTYAYKDFTICLDSVADLGEFIEVEKVVSDQKDADTVSYTHLTLPTTPYV